MTFHLFQNHQFSLHTALQMFLPIAKRIQKGTSLPILQHACVHDSILYCTNLEMMVYMRVDCDDDFLFPIDAMDKVYQSQSTGHITIDESEIHLIQNNRETVLQGRRDVDEYPTLPDVEWFQSETWPSRIIQIVHNLTQFASKDELKPALTGVNIRYTDGILQACATNGHQLKYIPELKASIDTSREWILPTAFIALLHRYMQTNITVSWTDDEQWFRGDLDDGIQIMTRTIDVRFPDFESVIPNDHPYWFSFRRKELISAVQQAVPASNPYTHQGVCIIEEKHIHLSVKNVEDNLSYSEKIPLQEQSGEQITFGMNVQYLLQILQSLRSANITCRYKNPIAAFRFDGDADPSQQLVMPIRLQE